MTGGKEPMHQRWNDKQLQAQLTLLIKTKGMTIVYPRAFVDPNLDATSEWYMDTYEKKRVALENLSLNIKRHMWKARILSVYRAIEGFAIKPKLVIKWNENGDCYISVER